MNWLILLPVLAVMVGLLFTRIGLLGWVAVVWVAVYTVASYAISAAVAVFHCRADDGDCDRIPSRLHLHGRVKTGECQGPPGSLHGGQEIPDLPGRCRGSHTHPGGSEGLYTDEPAHRTAGVGEDDPSCSAAGDEFQGKEDRPGECRESLPGPGGIGSTGIRRARGTGSSCLF